MSGAEPPAQNEKRVGFADRLLAEATRFHEQSADAVEQHLANRIALRAGGDFEQRLIVRARELPTARPLRHALHQVRGVLGWVIVLGIVLAAVLGAASARAVLGGGGAALGAAGSATNFYWALGGLLGVQSIALLLWIIAISIAASRRRAAGAAAQPTAIISLGSIITRAAHWLARRTMPDAHHRAAIAAMGRTLAAGRLARWSFSSITHGFWLAFNIGALVMVMLLLTARHHTFVWETTILREEHVLRITAAISVLPEAAGFLTPTEEQVRQSRWRPPEVGEPPPTGADEAWAGLLVGSLVIYGFAPRILLLGLSRELRRRARRMHRLDTTLPDFARLEPLLMPSAEVDEQAKHEGAAVHQHPEPLNQGRGNVAPRPPGEPALVGLEMNAPAGGWPPEIINGARWRDLGLIESRDQQQRILASLRSDTTEPAPLLIACDLRVTPDRGVSRALREFRQALSRPPVLLLSAGEALRRRGMDARQVADRIADWRATARRAGIADDRIIEIDLDHITDASAARLAELVSDSDESIAPAGDGPERRIEQAFATIRERIGQWSASNTAPSREQQAELHREIARLYRQRGDAWRDLLAIDRPEALLTGGREGAQRLAESGRRVVSLLPERLQRSSRWMAAGAAAGALGCIAAAALVSPVAIASLPAWSGIGAAIAAAAGLGAGEGEDGRGGGGAKDHAKPQAEYGGAARAAALFAMLLELQGRDEQAITRILDRAVPPHDEGRITDADATGRWLDDLRHRFDLAHAEEAR